jgi:hypothetical protein
MAEHGFELSVMLGAGTTQRSTSYMERKMTQIRKSRILLLSFSLFLFLRKFAIQIQEHGEIAQHKHQRDS